MQDAEQDGIAAAKRDIAAGDLCYKWIGHGGRGGKDFCRLVGIRLGMTVDDFGICFVTDEKIAFATGYNQTVADHIVAEHGRNLVEETMTEARELHKERYDRHVESLKFKNKSE